MQHIVRLSAAGADQEPGIQLARWHRAVEQAIEDSGVPWTFLRPNNLMNNFINFYPPDATGSIYLPWGTGACSWVDAADVGAVAATVLRGTGHAHAIYTLTGPAALTIHDVASALSAATGRTIRDVDVPEDTVRRTMLEFRVPEWLVDALMELHAVDKLGRKAAVTTTIQDVLGGHPARLPTSPDTTESIGPRRNRRLMVQTHVETGRQQTMAAKDSITKELYDAFQKLELDRWDAIVEKDVLINSPAGRNLRGNQTLKSWAKEFGGGFAYQIDLVDEHLATDDQGNGRGFITFNLHWKHAKEVFGLKPPAAKARRSKPCC